MIWSCQHLVTIRYCCQTNIRLGKTSRLEVFALGSGPTWLRVPGLQDADWQTRSFQRGFPVASQTTEVREKLDQRVGLLHPIFDKPSLND
jgi:hypothetical protein